MWNKRIRLSTQHSKYSTQYRRILKELTTGANLAIGSKFEFSDVILEVAAEDILGGDSIEFKKEFNESSVL